jgi:hypothetical protein
MTGGRRHGGSAMKRVIIAVAAVCVALGCGRGKSPEDKAAGAKQDVAAAPAKPALPEAPAPLAAVARQAVKDYLESCMRRDETAAAKLVIVTGTKGDLAPAVACEGLRSELAMARVGDAIVARFGPGTFRFTSAVWKEEYLAPVDAAKVEQDRESLLVRVEWGSFEVRQDVGLWKVAVTPSPQTLASPAEARARARQTASAADEMVRGIAAGQYASAQAAGRAFSSQLMALRRAAAR